VREHSLAKVPVLMVVGRREADEGTVAVRRLGSDGQQVAAFGDVLDALKAESLAPDLRRG
jgi:threonyl-tRNA synthetase